VTGLPSDRRLVAELRREILLGTNVRTGGEEYVPLADLRRSSMHVIGASGYGKSFFLRSLIRQFIRCGQAFGVIDPHGDTARYAADALRRSAVARDRVIWLDPSDTRFSVAFNPLACGVNDPGDAASLTLEACLKAWRSASFDETPRLERLLRGTFRMLAENDMTLLEAIAVLSVDNGALRQALSARVPDAFVREEWAEFEKWPRHEKLALLESSRNRLQRFLQSRAVQHMIGQREHALNLRQVMDDGHYLIADLGRVTAPESQRLLGALLVNAVFYAAKQRDLRRCRDWFLIVDECGQFATQDIANSLDELRKMGVHLMLSHQRLRQLQREDADVLSAVLTNAKMRVVFGGLERPEAEQTARELFTGQVYSTRVKHITTQTKFRPVLDWVSVETESWSESSGEDESASWSEQEQSGGSVSESDTYAVDDNLACLDDDDITQHIRSYSASASSATTRGGARTSHRSVSVGGSRSRVPITRHEEFREETSRQFESVDEQWERLTAAVHGLPRRQALIRIHNGPVLQVRTPDVADESDERSAVRFRDRVLERSAYVQPAAAIVHEIEARRRRLRELTDAHANGDRPLDVRTFRE
jgi:hypothetical protein